MATKQSIQGYDSGAALAEGWLLADNDQHGLRIERFDESERFDSDEDAERHVQWMADHERDENALAALRAVTAWRGSDAAINLYLRKGGASNGADCPFCGANNSGGGTIDGDTKTFSWDQGTAWIVVTCSGCNRRWHENFILDGINTVDADTQQSWDLRSTARVKL